MSARGECADDAYPNIAVLPRFGEPIAVRDDVRVNPREHGPPLRLIETTLDHFPPVIRDIRGSDDGASRVLGWFRDENVAKLVCAAARCDRSIVRSIYCAQRWVLRMIHDEDEAYAWSLAYKLFVDERA